MTTIGYSNQIAMSAATQDHDHGVLLSPIDGSLAIQPLNNGFIDAAAVSKAVRDLDQSLSLPRTVNSTNQESEADIPQQSTQKLDVPAKVRDDILTVTPAMEAYANDAATLPVIATTDTSKTQIADVKYHNSDSMSSATRLKRRILETDELIVCPGVYDGFSARIALSVGFTALYMVLCSFLSSLASRKHKKIPPN